MEQQYLLTYERFIKEMHRSVMSYAWFEREKDMEDFIKDTKNITVSEKMKITSCEYL